MNAMQLPTAVRRIYRSECHRGAISGLEVPVRACRPTGGRRVWRSPETAAGVRSRTDLRAQRRAAQNGVWRPSRSGGPWAMNSAADSDRRGGRTTGDADGGTGREPRRQRVRRGAMTGRATERAMDRRRGSGVRRRRQGKAIGKATAGACEEGGDGGVTVEVADLGASDGGGRKGFVAGMGAGMGTETERTERACVPARG